MKMIIRKIKHAFIEEWKQIWAEPPARNSLLVLGVVVSVIYTWAYSYEVTHDTPIAVIDHAQPPESRQFLRMIDANESVKITQTSDDLSQAKELFYKGEVRGIVEIPKDFSEKIFQKEQPSVSAYYDVARLPYYKQVYKAVATATAYMNGRIQLKGLMAKGQSEHQAQQTMTPVQSQVVTLFNPSGGYATYISPVVYLIAIQTLWLTAIGLLGGTARERNSFFASSYSVKNVLDILSLLLGKVLLYTFLAFVCISWIFWLVMPIFDIPQRGNMGEIYLFLLPFFMSVALLGKCLVRFFRSREDVVMSVSFTSIPFVLLSGVAWPLEALPRYLQILGELIPTTLSIRGFVALSQGGASLSDISSIYLKMWGVCLFYLVLAVVFFSKIWRGENEEVLNRKKNLK